jgi:hypothetical protein
MRYTPMIAHTVRSPLGQTIVVAVTETVPSWWMRATMLAFWTTSTMR